MMAHTIWLGALVAPILAVAAAAEQPSAVSGGEVAADFSMARCVNMGNSLETPRLSNWNGRSYTQADYERIAAAGFDTVRIPMRWSAYTGPNPDHRIHPDFLALADQQIAWAQAAGLNIIINVHHFDPIMEEPEAHLDRFGTIWEQLVEHYADLPDNVWFEVLNEPHSQLKGDLMRRAQANALNIIRAADPDRIVILGGEDWSGIGSLDTNLETDDPNVVYTFHYYDPFSFTHQQAQWLGDDMPKGTRGWGSDEDRDELAAAVKIATKFRSRVGRPVFLGEFGAHSPIDNAERVEWAGAVRTAMEEAQIPWCLWSYGNTFALYSDEAGWDDSMLGALVPPRP